MKLSAFACKLGWSEDETIINALSAGKARYRFWLDVREPWPDTKLMDIKVRKVGGPHTSARFTANAIYRGIPDWKCGDAVTVGKESGLIVGHNSSANLDILFTSGQWNGQVMNVHPSDVSRSSGDNGNLMRGNSRE